MSAMTAPVDTPGLRGKLTADAPLAKLVWFKSGGAADWLFEPADAEDLKEFLQRLEGDLPVMALESIPENPYLATPYLTADAIDIAIDGM